jgi:hypothetical protein
MSEHKIALGIGCSVSLWRTQPKKGVRVNLDYKILAKKCKRQHESHEQIALLIFAKMIQLLN